MIPISNQLMQLRKIVVQVSKKIQAFHRQHVHDVAHETHKRLNQSIDPHKAYEKLHDYVI